MPHGDLPSHAESREPDQAARRPPGSAPSAHPSGRAHRADRTRPDRPVHHPLGTGGETGPATTSAGRPRIAALDVVRGFALCGILLANVQPIANMGRVVVELSPVSLDDADAWLGLFVGQRFFPIFSLLFGVGFSLLLGSAADRAARPRLLLLRRLLALLAVGLAHYVLLWQGDILTVYAVVGLVVLLPSTWLPRWAVAGLAAALIPAAALFFGGFLTLVPGLFLLGSALVRYGVIDRIERSTRMPAVLGLILAAGAVPAVWWQVRAQGGDVGGADFGRSMSVAGLLLAGVYICVLLVLLRTPLRPALRAVFTPLGRMALTNYLTATLLVLGVTRFLDGPPHSWSAARVLLIAGAILAVQWLWSTLWLRRCRQGPVEWLWRWATWARRPPLSRTPEHVA